MSREVLVAALGALIVSLDGAVNIAFPSISAAFDVPATSIQWVVLTYIVSFSVALVPAGRLADQIGHARVFRGGLALAGAANLLCGLAPAWAWLLGARIVQGLAVALVMASAPALVTLSADPGRRGQALGRLGLGASLGMVVGPLAGGVLVGAWGWRVVYLGRLPLVVLALGLSRDLPAVDGSRRWARPAVGMAPGTPSPAAESRTGLFRDLRDPGNFALANAAHLLANAAYFAVWLLVPYYLIDRRGFPEGLGGLLFTTGPLAWACVTLLGGGLADRNGGRWVPPVGLAVLGAGLWLTGRLDDGASSLRIVSALGIGGLGYGLFVIANMHHVMGALPPARQGVAGSLVALMRTGGIVVGANVATAIYAARLSAYADLGPNQAAAAAFADVFTVAAAIAAAAAILGLVAPPRLPGPAAAPAS